MNGHRPCFIWAGLMPGLWTHWQGQINHTSFSLCLDIIEERKNERAEGGWKTHSLLLDRLQFYSVPGAGYASHRKKHTTTMLRKKKSRDRHITLKETSYWELKWVKRKIHAHKTYKKYSGSSYTMESDAGTWYLFVVSAWYCKVF